MIGKPCAGNLHALFNEGELEIEKFAITPALYSTLPLGGRKKARAHHSGFSILVEREGNWAIPSMKNYFLKWATGCSSKASLISNRN
jgi:hypothetical protein